MNISIDFHGAYTEHKQFFDEMAKGLQAIGHRVGIITGERESKRNSILSQLGFNPDFMHLWGEYETIANGAQWKVNKMLEENVILHFDDDATDMKRYTVRWIMKVLNSHELQKF